MKRYLLDTNICIYLLKKLYELEKKVQKSGVQNCFISEITIAELKFGAENSKDPQKNQKKIKELQDKFLLLPIFPTLDIYAKEKARLRKIGKMLDDFDLLIGATAITNNLIMVTKNVSDFDRMDGIEIEDWTISK